ncbi:hypothetical protein [Achromobacter sp. 413638]|uniref:hypothetical protein n=1 Tax=Achromobacter sp. 413638 TaxID=3342385 RepID=UPI00370A3ED4
MKANPRMATALIAAAAAIAGLVAIFGALAPAMAAVLRSFVVVRYGLSMLGIQGGSAMGGLANLEKGGFGRLGKTIVSVGKLLLGKPIGLASMTIATATYFIYQC